VEVRIYPHVLKLCTSWSDCCASRPGRFALRQSPQYLSSRPQEPVWTLWKDVIQVSLPRSEPCRPAFACSSAEKKLSRITPHCTFASVSLPPLFHYFGRDYLFTVWFGEGCQHSSQDVRVGGSRPPCSNNYYPHLPWEFFVGLSYSLYADCATQVPFVRRGLSDEVS
jgi:hypothetical protein